MTLFLDANAHLPMSQKTLNVFGKFNSSLAGHGHAMSSSMPGRMAASEIERSREKIAELIGAQRAGQIVFTSTCTEACEWGIELLKMQNFSDIYCSTIEHPAVSRKVRENLKCKNLFVNKDGMVNCSFDPGSNSALVCIGVHNEIGTIQQIQDVKAPLFSDMSQALGKIPVNVSSIPKLKLATFGAHKFGGPVGVGILYIQDTDWWKEYGSGSRYLFDRVGTPDAGMVVAAASALEDAIKTLNERYERALRFRNVFENGIREFGLEVMAEGGLRVPHTSFIKIGKKMGPFVMTQLESDGIYIGLGSACGSFNTSTSPVMSALGYGGMSHDYIRVSQWGDYKEIEAKKIVSALKRYCSNF